jgi:hypothetical protein
MTQNQAYAAIKYSLIANPLLGSVYLLASSLLSLKKRQSRREEKGLVIPNERRATQSGTFSGSTRRAGTFFTFRCVIIRLCRVTTLRSFCLAEGKNSLQQC